MSSSVSRSEHELANVHSSPWYRSDAAAISSLLVLCLAAAILRWIHADWMSGYDGFDDFLPDWGYMGDRLRELEIPKWNPYYSSGTPFAGDPGTGWMYLPIMLAFGVFQAVTAWKFLILLMSVICGLATYLFGRRLGLEPLPALFASASFAIGAVTYGLATDRIAVTTTYLPIIVGLLSAEMAIRANRLSAFLAWTALGGIGVSQNFAAWPAQGMIYTMMYVAGWLGYRWLFAVPPERESRRAVFNRALAYGVGMGIVALGFGAAAVWPLLDVTGQSTIAGGDYSNAVNGQPFGGYNPLINFYALLLQDTPYYRISTAAGAVVILALFATACFRNRYGVPFFFVAAVVFTDIAAHESITRWFFYLIPYFEHAHAHRPTASSAFIFPAINLLAGAGIQLAFEEQRFRRLAQSVAISIAVVLGFALLADWKDIAIGSWPIVLSILTGLFILFIGFLRLGLPQPLTGTAPRLAAVGFLIIMITYPTLFDYGRIWNGTGRTPGLEDVHIPESDVEWIVDTTVKDEDPGTAAAFLQRQRDSQQPFRYAVWYEADTPEGFHVPFIYRRLDPYIVMSLAGPRSGFLELEQISAYNPVHMKYYTEYFEFMQEAQQDYHFVDVFAQSLDESQLFSMLNVRYVIVPANVSKVPPIANYAEEVYRDPYVIIYENPYAFQRAWVVHDVQPMTDPAVEMKQLNDYVFDGHSIAYVDGDVPSVAPLPEGASADSVVIQSYKPEAITLQVSTEADGLLVLSEVYADGWKAFVDGEEVDILRTNHSLRGVPVTAGTSSVVLRYELPSLEIGLWITTLSTVGVVGIWVWAAFDRGYRRQYDLDN